MRIAVRSFQAPLREPDGGVSRLNNVRPIPLPTPWLAGQVALGRSLVARITPSLIRNAIAHRSQSEPTTDLPRRLLRGAPFIRRTSMARIDLYVLGAAVSLAFAVVAFGALLVL